MPVNNGVCVQCIVDWRKMTLTNSPNYARLKRAGIELVGVVCTPHHHLIEVDPDMHTKFIIFNDEDCILGSFNITFDRWWANWESGMTFHSRGVCRLLDNVFQSERGGVNQKYGIDPLSHFNLLYTFGRHALLDGKYYRPHHAILTEIHRARHSIKLVAVPDWQPARRARRQRHRCPDQRQAPRRARAYPAQRPPRAAGAGGHRAFDAR
jgi:phosphatidylserine/phosphatidylglycerophosphate/cardiolipin synthase-like enzyme